MRLLIVAMPCCADATNWIRRIVDQNWDIHLFPAVDGIPHPKLRATTFHTAYDIPMGVVPTGVRIRRASGIQAALPPALRLAEVIREIQPNLIHSLELRPSAELVLEAHRHVRSAFPIWAATDWATRDPESGPLSDEQFQSLFSLCDYFANSDPRPSTLPSRFGFRGNLLSGFTRPGQGLEVAPDRDSIRMAVEFYNSITSSGRCPHTAGSRGPELVSAWDRLAEVEQWLQIREAQIEEERRLVESLRLENRSQAETIWNRDNQLAEHQTRIDSLAHVNEQLTRRLTEMAALPIAASRASRVMRLARTGPYRSARLAWRGLRVLRNQGVHEFRRRVIAKCARLAARVRK